MNKKIIEFIDQSVLCWLATNSLSGFPNVSPKEIFTHYNEEFMIIANIASPNSVNNIIRDARLSICFIDIYLQRGYEIKGIGTIIKEGNEYNDMLSVLNSKMDQKFPIKSIIKVQVKSTRLIQAPSYFLFKEKTEIDLIEESKKLYKQKLKSVFNLIHKS